MFARKKYVLHVHFISIKVSIVRRCSNNFFQKIQGSEPLLRTLKGLSEKLKREKSIRTFLSA